MKKLLIIPLVFISLFAVTMTAQRVLAQTPGDSVCNGIGLAGSNGSCDPTGESKSVTQIIASVINILSFIIGIAGVIMVMVGGLKYITANGDSNAVSSAKTTLTYALIGLIVAAFAQVLVRFVLAKAVNGAPTSTPSICATDPTHCAP